MFLVNVRQRKFSKIRIMRGLIVENLFQEITTNSG